VPVTGPKQKLVTMTVTGGFAGVDQKVVLRGDGRVQARTRATPWCAVRARPSSRNCARCSAIRRSPMSPTFTINTGAADMFQYALQFNGRTVMTDRSAEQPPLDRLIDALSEWLPGR
jgi:hypothetical protein